MRPLPLADRGTSRYRYARTALSLPGDQMLCVEEGHQSGLYRPDTYHVFAERSPATQQHIRNRMQSLESDWVPYFHGDELHKLNLSRALLGSTLDWAYLDLCTALTRQVAWWLRYKLAEQFSPGAALGCTVVRTWRTSKFMAAACHLLRESKAGQEVHRQTAAMLIDAEVAGTATSSGWQDGNLHTASIDAIAAVRLLLASWEFDIDTCVEYHRDETRHCHRMTTFRIINLRPVQPPRGIRQLADKLTNWCLPPSYCQ